ncbi:hypothetical protein HK097_001439, partial [Rhizophlyctis rosea]
VEVGLGVLRICTGDGEEVVRELCDRAESDENDMETFSDEVVDMWYGNGMSEALRDFFFNAAAPKMDNTNVEDIEKASLDVWDSTDVVQVVEKGGGRLSASPRTPAKHNQSPRTPSKLRHFASYVGEIGFGMVRRAEDVAHVLRQGYLDGVYGEKVCLDFVDLFIHEKLEKEAVLMTRNLSANQNTVEDFVKETMPFVMDALEKYADKDRVQHVFVTHLTALLCSLQRVEDKYQILSSIDSAEIPEELLAAADGAEVEAVRKWVGSDKGSRRDVASLKTREAQMQITILLECLKVHVTTQTPLLDLPFVSQTTESSEPVRKQRKRKSVCGTSPSSNKKRRANDGGVVKTGAEDGELVTDEGEGQRRKAYERAVEDWMDRLCIWSSVLSFGGVQEEGGGLVKGFVEPVVVALYGTILPDLTKTILTKAGGGQSLLSAPPPDSPFFKKRMVTKVGSGMGGARRLNSASAVTDKGATRTLQGRLGLRKVRSELVPGSEDSVGVVSVGGKGRAQVTELLKRMAGRQVVVKKGGKDKGKEKGEAKVRVVKREASFVAGLKVGGIVKGKEVVCGEAGRSTMVRSISEVSFFRNRTVLDEDSEGNQQQRPTSSSSSDSPPSPRPSTSPLRPPSLRKSHTLPTILSRPNPRNPLKSVPSTPTKSVKKQQHWSARSAAGRSRTPTKLWSISRLGLNKTQEEEKPEFSDDMVVEETPGLRSEKRPGTSPVLGLSSVTPTRQRIKNVSVTPTSRRRGSFGVLRGGVGVSPSPLRTPRSRRGSGVGGIRLFGSAWEERGKEEGQGDVMEEVSEVSGSSPLALWSGGSTPGGRKRSVGVGLDGVDGGEESWDEVIAETPVKRQRSEHVGVDM